MPWGIIEGYSVFKGTIIAFITAAIGTSFLQSLIIAVVSASLSALGMVLSAYIATQATHRNREEIQRLTDRMDRRREEIREDDP